MTAPDNKWTSFADEAARARAATELAGLRTLPTTDAERFAYRVALSGRWPASLWLTRGRAWLIVVAHVALWLGLFAVALHVGRLGRAGAIGTWATIGILGAETALLALLGSMPIGRLRRAVDGAWDLVVWRGSTPGREAYTWRRWAVVTGRWWAGFALCLAVGWLVDGACNMLRHGGNPALPDHAQGVPWGRAAQLPGGDVVAGLDKPLDKGATKGGDGGKGKGEQRPPKKPDPTAPTCGAWRSIAATLIGTAYADSKPKVAPSPKTGDRAPERPAPPAPTYKGQPIPAPPPVRK